MTRAPLTPGRVVAAAIIRTDELGAQALTIAAIAKEFGVAAPALYKHVSGIEDLRGRMRAHLLAELADRLRREVTGLSGADALGSMAAGYRAFAHEHPGTYELTLAAPIQAEAAVVRASDEVVDVLIRIVAGYGIRGEAAIDSVRFVRASLHGFVSLELTGGFGLTREVDASFAALQASLNRALATWPS